MAVVEIPLTNQPNQSLTVSLPLDDGNITLGLFVYWNRVASYWQMNVNAANGVRILTGIPLLVSDGVYGDLFAQYQYMEIGTMFVFPISTNSKESPGLDDWDINFALVWGP